MSRSVSFYLGSLLVVLGVAYHSQAHALSDAEAEKILAILHPDAKSLAELQRQFPAFGKKQKEIASAGSQTGPANAPAPPAMRWPPRPQRHPRPPLPRR
jgi:hypothetical protein